MRDARSPGKARSGATVRWGLVLAVACAGTDIAVSVYRLLLGSTVAAVVLGFGVLTLAATWPTWRGAVWARNTVVAAQAMAGLTGVPAFVLPKVPPIDVTTSAARLIAALIVAVLLLTTTHPDT
jgi:hypothetical protein